MAQVCCAGKFPSLSPARSDDSHCGIAMLLLQSLTCWQHISQLGFGLFLGVGRGSGGGLYLGQEWEIRGVLIPGSTVVGTCSPGGIFVLLDKNWVVLLYNAKATGWDVL